MVDVSEKMIEAGVEMLVAWLERDVDDPAGDEDAVIAIYTAMHSAREVDGKTVERVATRILMALPNAVSKDGYVNEYTLARAAIAAMGEGDVR